MSQHHFESTTEAGDKLLVTMGYDRPLDYVFCTVFDKNEEVIYSNLDDDDAGTELQDVDYYRAILEKLGVRVPESMFREVKADQQRRVGNRVEVHSADQ